MWSCLGLGWVTVMPVATNVWSAPAVLNCHFSSMTMQEVSELPYLSRLMCVLSYLYEECTIANTFRLSEYVQLLSFCLVCKCGTMMLWEKHVLLRPQCLAVALWPVCFSGRWSWRRWLPPAKRYETVLSLSKNYCKEEYNIWYKTQICAI